MSDLTRDPSLEEQITQWREYLRRRQAIHSVDVAELEDHLREQVAALLEAGLAADEAFLVAVKRMGDLDDLSREFALEHSERLWKQLVVVGSDAAEPAGRARTDAFVAFGLAVLAAVLVKVPELFGIELDRDAALYARNLSFFVLPLLSGYFVWKRKLSTSVVRWLAVAFVAAGVFANVYPFASGGHTEVLTALHLPIALWLVVGVAYAGDRWRQIEGPARTQQSLAFLQDTAYVVGDSALYRYPPGGPWEEVRLDGLSPDVSSQKWTRLAAAPDGVWALAGDGTVVLLGPQEARFVRPALREAYALDMVDTELGWAGGLAATAAFVGSGPAGGPWTRAHAAPEGTVVRAIDLFGAADGWAVGADPIGQDAHMWRWDGTAWQDWPIEQTWESADFEVHGSVGAWAWRRNV